MIQISSASPSDIPGLVELINSGYRGDASKSGWTTEADLLIGEQRIDLAGLTEMMQAETAIVLKAIDAAGHLVGCVYLQQQRRGLYLGLLTVHPQYQALGTGRSLLKAAEDQASLQQIKKIFMTVISLRQELLDWYERNGYRPTGETRPFPNDPKFGIPTQPLELMILEKTID